MRNITLNEQEDAFLIHLTNNVLVLFYVAGFRPGRRGPLVSAKGPKTIDAQSGDSRWDGRQILQVRTNSLPSNKVPQIHESVRPKSRIAGVRN